MNYLKIYTELINRACYKKHKGFTLENHHVIPVCLGGTDDIENIVALTPEEHFVAHRLLTKIFPNERSIQFAFYKMCFGDYIEHGINNKIYYDVARNVKNLNEILIKENIDQDTRYKIEFERFKIANTKSTRELREFDRQNYYDFMSKEIITGIVSSVSEYHYKLKFSNDFHYKLLRNEKFNRGIDLAKLRLKDKKKTNKEIRFI